MSDVTLVAFDYAAIAPELATEARAVAARIRERLRENVSEIGHDLIAIKAKLPHGAFTDWIAAEFSMGARTAENYMRAAQFLADKNVNFSVLPPSAIYALAAPSAPAEVVAEVMAEVERGVVPKAAEIRERIAGATKAQLAAAQVRSAARAEKDRENEKRRRTAQQARDRQWKEDQAARDARRDDQAMKVAALLVSGLGPAGVIAFLNMLSGTDWPRLERLFRKNGHCLSATEIAEMPWAVAA